MKTGKYNYDFINEITDNKSRYLKLEGYLFPDTYDFYVDADPNYVITKFLDNFNSKWEDEYDKRAAELGLSRDEIITIASIIQKEAANTDQMKVISSVIHNRLNHQADYPTLGCDSTALYPSDTDYYFFAHDKAGNIYTASTFKEHKNNLVLIIKANSSTD